MVDAQVIDKQEAGLLAEDSTNEEEATQEGTEFESKQLGEKYEEEKAQHQKEDKRIPPSDCFRDHTMALEEFARRSEL